MFVKQYFMRPTYILYLVVIALLFSSCGPTKYTRVDASGPYGFSEWARDSSTWEVSFIGNGYTTQETADRYALFRAAELTVGSGYNSFIVLDHSAKSGLSAVRLSGDNKSVVSCPDPQTPVITKVNDVLEVPTGFEHSSTILIRLCRGRFNGSNPYVFDAKSMLTMLGPTIGR